MRCLHEKRLGGGMVGNKLSGLGCCCLGNGECWLKHRIRDRRPPSPGGHGRQQGLLLLL